MTQEDLKEAKYLAVDQEVFDLQQDDTWPEPESGVVQEIDAANLLSQESCIAYESCLKTLARTQIPPNCPRCSNPYLLQCDRKGTSLYIVWVFIISPSLHQAHNNLVLQEGGGHLSCQSKHYLGLIVICIYV